MESLGLIMQRLLLVESIRSLVFDFQRLLVKSGSGLVEWRVLLMESSSLSRVYYWLLQV